MWGGWGVVGYCGSWPLTTTTYRRLQCVEPSLLGTEGGWWWGVSGKQKLFLIQIQIEWKELQLDYFHKVTVILHYVLQSESHHMLREVLITRDKRAAVVITVMMVRHLFIVMQVLLHQSRDYCCNLTWERSKRFCSLDSYHVIPGSVNSRHGHQGSNPTIHPASVAN